LKGSDKLLVGINLKSRLAIDQSRLEAATDLQSFLIVTTAKQSALT
jgi:hypothetical protein